MFDKILYSGTYPNDSDYLPPPPPPQKKKTTVDSRYLEFQGTL